MILWIDAQLSPGVARWVPANFPTNQASALRDLGLRDAEDETVFKAARTADAVVLTKDSDFINYRNGIAARPKSSG